MKVRELIQSLQKKSMQEPAFKQALADTTGHMQNTLDTFSYSDATLLSLRLVEFLDSYMDTRLPSEVYRVIKSWEFDKTAVPLTIKAHIDPDTLDSENRLTHVSNVIISVARLANNYVPVGVELTSKCKGTIIELTTKDDIKPAAMEKCLQALQLHQKQFLARKNSLN